jgi:electron transfer flavoprotein beta subunit
MHLAVCLKYIPDPEAAFSMFTVDETAKRVVPAPGLKHVVSPFDEQALEAALRIREQHAGTRITVITLGNEAARNALKHGLAMGADDGVLISDASFEVGDGYVTARALAAAIQKLGAVDMALTGRQAADGDAGIVGATVGELLDVPVLTFAGAVTVQDHTARVERVLADGMETVEAELPVLVTVSNELGAPRTPSLRETMRAARKPVVVWKAEDLGFDAVEPRSVRVRVFAPSKAVECEFIEAATPEEQGVRLAARLREAKVL